MRSHGRAVPVWIGLLGALALGQLWLDGRRPLPPDLRAGTEIEVTSLADDGPGSLREAIFAAAVAPGRVRVRLPAGRVVVETPLPPLVGTGGVVLDGTAGASVIDATALSGGPVIDIDTPGSQIRGVTFVNAPEQAVLARQAGLRIVDSVFDGCDQGVAVADGVHRAVVERSVFTDNRLGVWLGADGSADIRDSRFARHTEAAIWSVRRDERLVSVVEQLVIVGNQFETDRVSLVLANTPVRVEANVFTGAREAAVFLLGEGAVVRDNRVTGGDGIGMVVENAHGALVDANEIDHNAAIGIMVRSSGDALVRRNRLHDNGYGIAFVFGRAELPNTGLDNTLLRQEYDGVIVIGDSPILRDNQVLGSRLAGLRVLDYYSAAGARTPANPLLERNVVAGNLLDAPVRGEYRARPEETDGERHD